MADKQATFNVKVESDPGAATQGAAALEKYRAAISASQDAVKRYRGDLALLRGSSDAVTKAKEGLKAKIDAERDSISRNNLAIIAAGKSFTELAKKNREATRAASESAGVMDLLREKLSDLAALGVAGILTAGAVAFAAFTASIAAATFEFLKFSIASANALRTQALLREAATGSAENATALGHEIDRLGQSLATPRAELNALAIQLAKTFDASKVSGAGIEDTFEAVASASAAGADNAAAAIKSIVEAGKVTGRTGIFGPQALQGTGLKFENVAANLAKQLNIGLLQAKQALLAGIAPVDAVAAALKDTVNDRFGQINAKRLLDLDVITTKWKDNLQGLSSDLARSKGFQTFLENVKKAADIFSDADATGRSLRVALSGLGDVLGALSGAALPSIRTGVELAAIGILKLTNFALDAAIAFVNFKNSALGSAVIQTILYGIAVVAGTVAAAFVVAASGVALLVASFGALATIVSKAQQIGELVRNLDWKGIGMAILQGIAQGITSTGSVVLGAVAGVASGIKKAFTDALGIHSPSAVFQGYGENVSKGAAAGISKGTPEVQGAISQMAPAPPQGGGAASNSSSAPKVEVVFNIHGGNAQETAALLQSSSVLEHVTHAIELALRGAGVPTQVPVTP